MKQEVKQEELPPGQPTPTAPDAQFDVSTLDTIVSLMNNATGEVQKTASDQLAK